ncbi:MAG: NAD-dependent succinate-semialdehyde dehydrogenase [Sphingobacteriales bacterium]|nr:NAD-dependent succinate-semialdehyde dehydrogenase [Sphingobacteriales bacterium]OJY91909.1 MAG: succinate-semialdehyde dehydrogenase [Sphingobacteriales bacterium 44-15]
MSITSINPVNGKLNRYYEEDNPASVGKKIDQTHKAWLLWRETGFPERAALLRKMAENLRHQKEELAVLMTIEMGKPVKDGVSEIEKCALVCDYYAAEGTGFLKDEIIATEAAKSYVSFQPLGIVLAVMPWNFPFWQVFRFLAPALMAGNCGLLKHASNVPGCAQAIEQLVRVSGFPDNVFQTLMIGSGAVNAVIEHPGIKAVTLTGSTGAGMKVAAEAGRLLKKTVLELGGSDPYIILADADLEQAAETCVYSRLINNGQSCIAAKRFIVVSSVEEEFTALFKEKMMQRKTGDPFDAAIDLGPMARADLRDELHRQVQDNIAAGAKCILGGKIPSFEGEHAFYEPTILTGVKKGMPAYSEEIFGPVASIISATDTDDAVRLANDTFFGLGGAVFTKDLPLGEEIARNRLQAGSCFVNTFVKSDPRLPFGGINQSGYGRELGLFGIREFVNIKTVYIR